MTSLESSTGNFLSVQTLFSSCNHLCHEGKIGTDAMVPTNGIFVYRQNTFVTESGPLPSQNFLSKIVEGKQGVQAAVYKAA